MADPAEFADWELLRPSSPTPEPDPFASDDAGAIQPDYFSLSHSPRVPRPPPSEPLSDDSDRLSWLDPDSHSKFDFSSRNPADFWSDESSSPPDSVKGKIFGGFEQESYQKFEFSSGNPADFWSDESSSPSNSSKGEICGACEQKIEGVGGSLGEGAESECGESVEVSGGGEGEVEEEKVGVLVGDGAAAEEKKRGPWWKLPIELLKFYVLRVRPFWSVSIAAAIVGIVMLGRRLYKIKQKSRSVALKLSLDDKKASMFMARAARLNEAFSVVKRAPIIRPSLPAGGVTPWPVLGFALT